VDGSVDGFLKLLLPFSENSIVNNFSIPGRVRTAKMGVVSTHPKKDPINPYEYPTFATSPIWL
jgi:hypothetical protein